MKRHLIVGLGSIGKRHADILVKNGYEVAGIDPYSIDRFGFKIFDDFQSGWGFNPDMVWICSPTALHADQACEMIEKGCHLFIEKPVAHTPDQAKRILDCFQRQKKNKIVWVGCNMRFHPAVVNVKKNLDNGLIGKALIFRIHFSHWLPNMRPKVDYRDTYTVQKDGGGIILDDIHDIDIALWLAGPVKKVSGLKMNSGLLEIAAEDVAVLNMIHENQSVSIIHMDFLRKDKSRGIEIIGEKGSIEWRSRGKNPERSTITFFPPANGEPQILYDEKITDSDTMFEAQLKCIQERIQTKRGLADSLFEACEALKIAWRIKGSCP